MRRARHCYKELERANATLSAAISERDAADAARRRGQIVTPGRRSAFPTPRRFENSVADEISGAASRAEARPSANLGFDGEGAPGTGDAPQKPKFVRPSVVRRGDGPEKRTPRRVGL